MWPQSTPLTTFSPYQPPGEGGSGTHTLAGLRGLCHFHKVTEGTLTDARGLACGCAQLRTGSGQRRRKRRGEEGVRESRGGGRGKRRGEGGGGKDKGEAEGEGRKGEECEEGAPLPQGPHSSPTGTKAPAPSVPGKIDLCECLVSPGIMHPEDWLCFPLFHLNSLGLAG